MLRSTRRKPKGAIARTDAVKPFEVEKVSRAETIQIGVMWLKFCFVMEEDVEGKVKTFNHKEGMNDFTHLGSKVVNELVVLWCMENLRG
jgi:hypothetical protein